MARLRRLFAGSQIYRRERSAQREFLTARHPDSPIRRSCVADLVRRGCLVQVEIRGPPFGPGGIVAIRGKKKGGTKSRQDSRKLRFSICRILSNGSSHMDRCYRTWQQAARAVWGCAQRG